MEIKINKDNAANVEHLKSQLSANFSQAMSGREDKVERFQDSFLYYMEIKPEKQEGEISDFVEPVVRRAVDSIKPSIMNVFTENEKQAVTFRPTSFAPLDVCKQVNDTINKIFLYENDGYDTIEKCVTEALVSGDTFTKVYSETITIEEDTIDIKDMPLEELQMILDEYKDTDLEKIVERNGLLSGEITPKKIEETVIIEHVPFQHIFITGDQPDIADASYVAQAIHSTVGELVELGFDKELLKSSDKNTESDHLSLKKLVNFGVFSEDDSIDNDFCFDEMTKSVVILEHYVYSSLFDKKSRVKMYQVFTNCQMEVLRITEVDSHPFCHGVMERIPGSFWGVSLYDKFRSKQDTLSRYARVAEANAMYNTYQRYSAVKGEYDRNTLLNNRPGSIIEVTKQGAVDWFPKSELPQTVFEILNRVSMTTKEDIVTAAGVDVTGSNISATAAMISANSADMKDKVIARTLAYTLFKPMFKKVYDIIRVGTQLPLSGDFQIDVNTANDDGILGSQLMQLGNMFAQWSQSGSPILTPPGMLNMAKAITGLGDEEILSYFPMPAEPTPEEQQEAAIQKQIALESQVKQVELMDAQMQLAVAQIAKTEQETQELILDGEANRLRKEEESVVKFKQMELKERELEAEIESGEKITVGKY